MKQILNKKGENLPFVGLGTFPFQGQEMVNIVKSAVSIGYRIFDTADDYRGEPGIGEAVKELVNDGICEREDVFLQTKISDNNAHSDDPLTGVYFNANHPFMHRHSVRDIVREKVDISLRSMNTNYLDSLLIHYPYPKYYVDIWKEMIELKKEGIVRYIGVSNFHIRHLKTIMAETGVFPEINEIYISPICTKEDVVSYCINNECIPMAYSPLMDVSKNRIQAKSLDSIMKTYNKSLAQTILRWNIDRGCIPLPKSKNIMRLKENFDVFDFSITEVEINAISGLNRDYQYLVESKICPGL